MIFLDTSAVYALADRDDRMHDEAVRTFSAAELSDEEILTHSYVLVESAALLHKRLGLRTALDFLDSATSFTLVWVDRELHDQGVCYLKQRNLANLSLVDALSVLVMRDKAVGQYLGFDKHFDDAGFSRYSP